MLSPKVAFALRGVFRVALGGATACPSCLGTESEIVARKRAILSLRRCRRCDLMYRSPTSGPDEMSQFYRDRYVEGYTTKLPTDAQLAALLATDFVGSDRDHSRFVSVLDGLGVRRGCRLLDFGCSWGYGSWQLRKAGFQVASVELEGARADYARRHLDVPVTSIQSLPDSSQDVFFSAHVLEHIPSFASVRREAWRVLREGGLFVGIVPNGSDERRRVSPRAWMMEWGIVHPLFFDGRFVAKAFARDLVCVGSIAAGSPAEFRNGVLDGEELVFVARKHAVGDPLPRSPSPAIFAGARGP